MADRTNPFETLQPVLLNEEDAIRKGIFGYTLRKLSTLTFESKIDWCRAVKTAMAPRPLAGKKLAAATAAVEAEKRDRSADSTSDAPEAKQPRLEATTTTGDAAVTSVEGVTTTTATSSSPATATTVEANSADQEGLPQTTEAASEFIAAFMRVMLERVVGGSLSDLSVPQLAALCRMVGITTQARSKNVLYSTLASFHFTSCEKLGKRVVRNTFAERAVREAGEMLARASAGKSTVAKVRAATAADDNDNDNGDDSAAARNKKSRLATAATAAAAAAAAENKRLAKAARLQARADKEKKKAAKKAKADEQALAAKAARKEARQQLRQQKQQQQHLPFIASAQQFLQGQPVLNSSYYSDNEDDEDGEGGDDAQSEEEDDDDDNEEEDDSPSEEELEVQYGGRVFQSKSSSATAGAPSNNSNHGATPAQPLPGGGWTLPEVEKKVASIVQLYDPVTVAIVVKKLAQMKYTDQNAVDVVEGILRRFHHMQLIFYDNGIAYMM